LVNFLFTLKNFEKKNLKKKSKIKNSFMTTITKKAVFLLNVYHHLDTNMFFFIGGEILSQPPIILTNLVLLASPMLFFLLFAADLKRLMGSFSSRISRLGSFSRTGERTQDLFKIIFFKDF
jgi:hypothetical protein